MRSLRLALVVVLQGAPLAAGCAAVRPGSAAASGLLRPARINHVVFFKLRDPAEAPQLIHDCNELLKAIPGIVAGWAGRRLDAGAPEDQEGEYDVSFYAGFNSQADLDAYIDHPLHGETAAKWGPLMRRVRVHDVLDEPLPVPPSPAVP